MLRKENHEDLVFLPTSLFGLVHETMAFGEPDCLVVAAVWVL